jgi:hypothetical protein
MRDRLLSTLTLVGLAGLAGCGDGPADPGPEPLAPEVALELLAAEANRDGDVDAASGFSGGALALRMGVRPSEIAVQLDGRTVRYLALVAGIARQLRNGDVVLQRTLIAWTGDPHPTAVLQVSLVSDQGVFGFPSDLASAADPRGRARGTWVNLRERLRFVATAGGAGIQLASTGAPCEGTLADLRCVEARYDVRVNGVFHALLRRDGVETDASRRLEIQTAADGVNGVLVGPREP